MQKLKSSLILLLLICIGFTSCKSNENKEETTTDEILEENVDINILPFLKDKMLTIDDINFLELIFELADKTSRGMVTEVTFDGKTYKVGDKITKEDASIINKTIESYTVNSPDLVTNEIKAEVSDGNSRGCGYYCYYYYWDYSCRCYRYYWYYCCL